MYWGRVPFHLLMDQTRKDELFKSSQTHYFVEKVSSFMAGYLPQSDDVKKKIDETGEDLIKKKLEEQDLLGNGTKDKKIEEKPSEQKDGYSDAERKKLESLFNSTDPTMNE